MAEVLVFCSVVKQTSPTDAVGLCDVHLRHPRTHAVGFQSWRRAFPVDLSKIGQPRREYVRRDDVTYSILRYGSPEDLRVLAGT
jgi:hypothetical protein